MAQLKKNHPDPRLEQVEIDEEYEISKVTGHPQRIGKYRGLFRANREKMGTFWGAPGDYRNVFEMMAKTYARLVTRPGTHSQLHLGLVGLSVDLLVVTLLFLMEEASLAIIEKAGSSLAQRPNSCQARNLCKQLDQAQAKKGPYLQECSYALRAGGRLEDVEEEK